MSWPETFPLKVSKGPQEESSSFPADSGFLRREVCDLDALHLQSFPNGVDRS